MDLDVFLLKDEWVFSFCYSSPDISCVFLPSLWHAKTTPDLEIFVDGVRVLLHKKVG